MMGRVKPKLTLLPAGCLCAVGSLGLAETAIENPLDTVNDHYAIASKHYGDGKVQIHTRADGEDGSQHSVLTVNCKDQTYRTDFESSDAPDAFPMNDYDDPTEPLNRDSAVVPMAQYACEEHGHPLLEWRW